MRGIPAGADWMLLTYERKCAAEAFCPPRFKHQKKEKTLKTKIYKKKKEPIQLKVPFHELCF